MSAEIIQLMPRPQQHRSPAGFPRPAFCSSARVHDLTWDHADTSPCEYVPPDRREVPITDG